MLVTRSLLSALGALHQGLDHGAGCGMSRHWCEMHRSVLNSRKHNSVCFEVESESEVWIWKNGGD